MAVVRQKLATTLKSCRLPHAGARRQQDASKKNERTDQE
jgi:hypothetical protein